MGNSIFALGNAQRMLADAWLAWCRGSENDTDVEKWIKEVEFWTRQIKGEWAEGRPK